MSRKFEARTLQARIESVLGLKAAELEVSFRPMFGGITGYTRGRNFVSLSNVGLALKLNENDRDELLKIRGARPLQYEPGGPVSKSSVVVPASVLDHDDQLDLWLGKSMAYCGGIPVKKKRPTKKTGSTA